MPKSTGLVRVEAQSSEYLLSGCTIPTPYVEVRITLHPRRRGPPQRQVCEAGSTLAQALKAALKAWRHERSPATHRSPRVADFLAAARKAFRRAE